MFGPRGSVDSMGRVIVGAGGEGLTARYPSPVGANDWPSLIQEVTRQAYQGSVFMSAQDIAGVQTPWHCLSHEVFPSGGWLTASAGVTVKYDCRPLGPAESASPIYRDIQPAVTTTLAALGVIGARTITVASAAALAIGDRILLEDPGKAVRGYQIEDIAGAVVTLDAPLPYPFPNTTSTVTKIPVADQCRDIRINGGNMLFTPNVGGLQVADKIIELLAAWDCHISDIIIDSSGAALMGVSYDMGGVRNTWERLVQSGGGNSQNGISLEGNRDSKILECNTRDNALVGFGLGSCTNCLVEGCESDHDYYGVFMSGLTGDDYGCTGCTVRNTTIRNSVSSAVAVGYGSAGNTLDNVTTIDCNAGIQFGAFTGAASANNRAVNCNLQGGNNGLITSDGAANSLLENCLMTGQTGANAYLTSGPNTFVNCRMVSDPPGNDAACQISAGVVVHCDGLEQVYNGGVDTNGRFYFVGAASTLLGVGIKSKQNANKAAGTYVVFQAQGGGSVMDVSDVEVSFFDNTTGVRAFYLGGGNHKFKIENYKQTNGYAVVGLLDNTSTIEFSGTLDITNIGAGGFVLFEAGGATQAQCNVGSFTGTGAPQDIAIPQIAANSVVRFWKPGGVEVQIAYTITPATKITLTTAAGTYFWQLIT